MHKAVLYFLSLYPARAGVLHKGCDFGYADLVEVMLNGMLEARIAEAARSGDKRTAEIGRER